MLLSHDLAALLLLLCVRAVDVDKWLKQAAAKDVDRKHSSSSQHQHSPGPDLMDLNTSESC